MNTSRISKISALGAVVFLSMTSLAMSGRADDAPAKPPTNTTEVTPPTPAASDAFDLLMTSLQNDDYAGFIVAVDDDFKAALSRELFESAVKTVAPHEKKGYEATYWGSLNRQGYVVYHWKLTFKDGSDDMLAVMTIKKGKIGGFFML